MFGQPFYFGYTRKFITVFGTLFNNISIERPYDGDQLQTIKVPLTYSSQDKMLARLGGDPDLNRKAAAITPAMSFEYIQPVYDQSRKLQPTLQNRFTDSSGVTHSQYIGVPYNFDFVLYIYSKEEEDGLRVLEQIMPYFQPGLTVTVKMIPEMDITIDVPIILNSIDFENRSYGEFTDRRQLIWTLKFTMKAQITGPVQSGRKIIKVVHDNFRDKTTGVIMEEVHVQPGLLANGSPTTSIDDTIPATQIQPDDEYGYIVEILKGPNPHG